MSEPKNTRPINPLPPTLPHLSQPPSPSPSLPPPQIPYTTFLPHQKILLTILLPIATLASPLTATIYFPLLPLLTTTFHTTPQSINFTITIYLIFQALSPALFAPLADSPRFGRRPVLLATFTLYTLANLGLALNLHNSYAALFVLCALQSLGASAIIAIAYGVVADVSTQAERGKMLGPVMAATNVGPCVGPILGGWVALASGGFRWVFWCLVIYGGVTWMVVGWFFPETGRKVVGNGSVKAEGWSRTWWRVLEGWIVGKRGGSRLEEAKATSLGERGERGERFNISNSLACLRIIFWRDTALVLWMQASFYSVWYCIQTSIPCIYKEIYGFNEIEIGLSYLAGGAGVILGGFATGRMLDRNYTLTAKEIGHTVDRVSGDDMNRFPIERARSRGSWPLMGISTCALVGYGWAVQKGAHPSIPLILQCVLGFMCTVFNQMFNALLVDAFPENPSSAAASGNITRCALSAAAIAALQPLTNTLNRGWLFTLLSAVNGIGGVFAIFLIQTKGMKWRRLRTSSTTKPRGNDTSGEIGLPRPCEGHEENPLSILKARTTGEHEREVKIDGQATSEVVGEKQMKPC